MIRKRKSGLDDGAIIRLIRQELVPLTPPELQDRSVTDRELLRRIGRGTTFVWSSSVDVRASGFVSTIRQGDVLLVDLLATAPRHRRKGIGTALLKKAEHHAWALGCSGLQLYVNNGNEAAIRFYEKNGLRRAWYEPGLDSIVMRKAIRPGTYM